MMRRLTDRAWLGGLPEPQLCRGSLLPGHPHRPSPAWNLRRSWQSCLRCGRATPWQRENLQRCRRRRRSPWHCRRHFRRRCRRGCCRQGSWCEPWWQTSIGVSSGRRPRECFPPLAPTRDRCLRELPTREIGAACRAHSWRGSGWRRGCGHCRERGRQGLRCLRQTTWGFRQPGWWCACSCAGRGRWIRKPGSATRTWKTSEMQQTTSCARASPAPRAGGPRWGRGRPRLASAVSAALRAPAPAAHQASTWPREKGAQGLERCRRSGALVRRGASGEAPSWAGNA